MHSLVLEQLTAFSLHLLALNFSSQFPLAGVQLILSAFHLSDLKRLKSVHDLLPSFQMSEITRMQGPIIGTWTLALITVCLRYFARKISKAGFWYDDWVMIPAIVSIP